MTAKTQSNRGTYIKDGVRPTAVSRPSKPPQGGSGVPTLGTRTNGTKIIKR